MLAAFQRNDVSNNINTIITIVQYSLQIVLILMFRNYYYYAVVFPVCTIGGNLIRAIIVDKLYPQYISSGEVPLEEKHQIYKRTFGLALSLIHIYLNKNYGIITAILYSFIPYIRIVFGK